MLNKNLNLAVLMFLTTTSLFVACKKDDTTTPPVVSEAEFKNRSVTPAFIKMGSEFSNVGVYTLVSSEDAIPNSNNMTSSSSLSWTYMNSLTGKKIIADTGYGVGGSADSKECSFYKTITNKIL